MDDEPDYRLVLDIIAISRDLDKLIIFAANAKKRNVTIVRDAAIARIKTLLPRHKKASYKHAFWNMMVEYLSVLIDHNKPTLKLYKAWKMALRDSEVEVHTHWVENGDQAWALQRLIANGSTSLSAEGIALKFSDLFEEETKVLAECNLKFAKAKMLEKY